MEDQDRKTPEEEADVEGHAIKEELQDDFYARDEDDDVEAHALREDGLMEDGLMRSAKDELNDDLA